MKKKILSTGFSLALLVAATAGIVESKKNNVVLNDLALANLEALATGETSDEFYQATGCWACICSTSCSGKDGRTYSHASSTRP